MTQKLQLWYNNHKRQLPWRETSDPYKIWISEIILQQTQVKQGLVYYLNIIEKYPDVKKLAEAKEDDLMRLWQGLGYYSRALNMLDTAREIVSARNGQFPSTYKELIRLKGIGPYTASALLSIAFNKPYAVLDGNVYRFLSRYFGIDLPINAGAGKKKFSELANKLIDQSNPGNHNQAMMEFGATVCTHKNPQCDGCFFNEKCYAFAKNVQDQLPVKNRKSIIKHRYFHYFLILNSEFTYIKKRDRKDIWRSLYELPLIETETFAGPDEILKNKNISELFQLPEIIIKGISEDYRHHLTHQQIIARFYQLQTATDPKGYKKVKIKDLTDLAFPKIIINYLSKLHLKIE